MKTETIQQRIESTEKQIEKKQKSIQRYQAFIDKVNKQLLDKNLTIADCRNLLHTVSDYKEYKFYFDALDIEYREDDIRRLKKEIANLEAKLDELRAKDAEAQVIENIYQSDVPDVLHELEYELINRWDEYDKEYRDSDVKKPRTYIYYTDEEIHKQNVEAAKVLVLDLYNRVYSITGPVTNWSNITLQQSVQGPVLNGIVQGKLGKVRIESILAGGYNIQKLHVRVLVKSI